VDQLDDNGEDCEEFREGEAYVGPLNGRLNPSFRIARDLFEGYFGAVRPANGDFHPVWIARALSDPNSNPENSNCLHSILSSNIKESRCSKLLHWMG